MQIAIDNGAVVLGLYIGVTLKGFCWCAVDHGEHCMWINAYSVDRQLWHSKEHFNVLIRALKWVKLILKLDRVMWLTTRPGLYEKMGFHRSKHIAMEA